MAVISISITESVEQVISGIPRFITISTNTVCTIFFTLDGTDPDMFSEIYTSSIKTPVNVNSLTLKVMATDGVTISPIIEAKYATNIMNNIRLPHSGTTNQNNDNQSLYPFGDHYPEPGAVFLNPADSSVTVNDPTKAQYVNGFGADGQANSFSNEPLTVENYAIRYTVNNAQGEMSDLIGTLPKVKAYPPVIIPETTERYSLMFNPKALVIFQDASQEDPTSPPAINRQFFSLLDIKNKDGSELYSTGLESPPVGGSFVSSHYNPRDNTVTDYFFDSFANRWIISKAPFEQIGNNRGNLSGGPMNPRQGMQFVFKWINGMHHYLI